MLFGQNKKIFFINAQDIFSASTEMLEKLKKLGINKDWCTQIKKGKKIGEIYEWRVIFKKPFDIAISEYHDGDLE